MGLSASELEKFIEVHRSQMFRRVDGPLQRIAASQVALHTAQWLELIGDARHQRWSEMLDLLCTALQIMADEDGDTPQDPTDPNSPVNPYGGIQTEWAEMLRSSLRGVLMIIGLDEEVVLRINPVKKAKDASAFHSSNN